MVRTTLFLPQCNDQLPIQTRSDEPQQQIEKKEGCRRRNGGERETRGILSLLSRRPILSCSPLTSLRFSVAIEPATQSCNAFPGSFAVSPNLDREISPIIGWTNCCGDFGAHVFSCPFVYFCIHKPCVCCLTLDCQYSHYRSLC